MGIATVAILEFMGNHAMSQARCDALKVAKEYIAKRYPDFDPSGLKLIITEKNNLWQLTYALPEGTLGGVPVITIDKRACSIVRAQHTQ